jgi:transketolase
MTPTKAEPLNMKKSTKMIKDLEGIANQLRQDVIRMTCEAGSGHPGGSLGAADLMAALYFHALRIDPDNPDWSERDRFILSKGHACPVLYAALARRGYFSVDHLNTLRKTGSILQGHPDMLKTPGVDMTTGSLGNGLAVGVGMALGGRMDAASFRVYVMLGDGDLQEGCTWEAVMMAGHHKLSKLTAILDYNRAQVDGLVSEIVDPHPVAEKWLAFNWQVCEIDGNDLPQILNALAWAKNCIDGPTLILARTVKGKGVSFIEAEPVHWHGTAPNREQAAKAIQELALEKKI